MSQEVEQRLVELHCLFHLRNMAALVENDDLGPDDSFLVPLANREGRQASVGA
ncbi:MAG: hypothetical protein ACLQOO_36575 [Terriglobia bacterium]